MTINKIKLVHTASLVGTFLPRIRTAGWASGSRVYRSVMLGTPEVFALQSLRVHGDQDIIVIEPADESCQSSVVIERKTAKVSRQAIGNRQSKQGVKVFGVAGIVELVGGPHLVCITEKSLVGRIGTEAVYRIEQVEISPIKPPSEITPATRQRDATYKNILKNLLESRDFYFSYTLDLTNTLSRKCNVTYKKDAPICDRVDERFFWNKSILQSFIEKGLHEFVIPILRGCIQITHISTPDVQFDLILLSRRSRHRAGTRYNRRGSDDQGNVANYVETEQVSVIY